MTDYTISDARYAKGKVIIRPTPDGTGFRTRADRLAATFGHWVHRSKGYTVTPSAAKRFEEMYTQGWDASFIDRGAAARRAPEEAT